MDNVVQQKSKIRSLFESQRRSLSGESVDSQSSKIISHLKNLPEYQGAKTVHCYVAWRNEVNTNQLIKDTLQTGRRVIVPVIDLSSHILLHSEIKGFDELKKGTFGILEPPKDRFRKVKISEFDLVIVPGVAFDLSGHRIGFGGGFYDGFLGSVKATKIALAYEFQIVDEIPTRAEDEKVDILVSEKNVYRFSA